MLLVNGSYGPFEEKMLCAKLSFKMKSNRSIWLFSARNLQVLSC